MTARQITVQGGNPVFQGGSGQPQTLTIAGPSFGPRPIDLEAMVATVLFAVPFGVLARMLLLRWRRAWVIGLVLGGLVFVAYILGAWFTYWERRPHYTIEHPFNADTFMLALISAATVLLGVMISWPIWTGLARLFLPKRSAGTMLEWQRSMSDPSSLARQ